MVSRDRWLVVEYVVLFFGSAMVMGTLLRGISPIPFLVAIAIGVAVYLRRSPTFDRSVFWGGSKVRAALPSILGLFLGASGLLVAAVALFIPEHLFDLPRTNPLLWVLVMVFYPLFSVYPQELFFRVFLFARYEPAFGRATVLASASAFGIAHIAFGSWISVAMTFVGGLVFADRYRRTRSALVVAIEHALYGCLVFTIGLGAYFYHGALPR